MPKRRRPRDPRRELQPEHARPLDPEYFKAACKQALAAAAQPHYLLHERVSPHFILREGGEDIPYLVSDHPLTRMLMILTERYQEQFEHQSAGFRFIALGRVVKHPALAEWVGERTETHTQIHDAVIEVAATAPLNARGEFLIKPFCEALARWAANHPDPPKEGEA